MIMPEIYNRQEWGSWTIERDNLTLNFREGRHSYQIDLEPIYSSAQVLDWIFQVRGKGWASPKVMADLLEAFHDIFHPQATLCSGGDYKFLNRLKWPKELRRRLVEIP